MTAYFVDSAASGSNDGTSIANAWTDVTSASAVAVTGDIVFISHTHSQTPTATLTVTWAKDVRIISSDFGDIVGGFPVRRVGANFTPTGSASDINWRGPAYTFGCVFSSPDKGSYGSNVAMGLAVYHECSITSVDDVILVSGDTSTTKLISTSLNLITNDSFRGSQGGLLEMTGGSITRAAGSVGVFVAGSSAEGSSYYFSGVDMTGIPVATPLMSSTTNLREVILDKCKFNIGQALGGADINENATIELFSSDTDTLTAAVFEYERHDFYGHSVTVLTHYRTGGADDGQQSNGYSQKVTALAERTIKGFKYTRVPISIYIGDADGTARTLTLHFAHGGVGSGTAGAAQDNEVAIVGEGPSNAATADSLAETVNTFPATGQEVDLATTAETWNGAGITIKQKISFQITPKINGLFSGWFCFSSGSATDKIIYSDLTFEVS